MDVRHIAKLSNLEFTEDELREMEEHFNAIMEYFKKLSSVDTERVEPTFYVIKHQTPMREDRVKKGLEREDVLAIAPHTEGGYIRVPRIR